LIATIVFIAVGPSVIAYRSWGLAVAEAGPAMAAIFYNLTPLIAAVLSVLVIGEWPEALSRPGLPADRRRHRCRLAAAAEYSQESALATRRCSGARECRC
jgi:chromate transport protein ChrA